MYDKGKVHHESLSQIHVQPKEKNTYDNKQTDNSITIEQQTLKMQNTNNKLPTRNSYQSSLNGNETVETVDLKVSQIPQKTIHQFTLLVGSSIFKNIRVNDLKKNTAIRSFPGAIMKPLQDKLQQFNIDKC